MLKIVDTDSPLVERFNARPAFPEEAETAAREVLAAVRRAGDAAPLVRRLGAVPYWRGAVRCQEALSRIYSRVRPVAIDAAAGRSIDLRSGTHGGIRNG